MSRKDRQPAGLRLPERLEFFWTAAGAACVGIVVITLFFCGEYPGRLADNRFLMLFVLLFFLSGGALYWLSCKRRPEKAVSCAHPVLFLLGVYAVLYVIQVFWVSRVYFYTGWDVGTIREHVKWIVDGGTMQDRSIDALFSIYPNNLLFFYLSCLIEKLGIFFSMAEPYNLCIYFSCLCVNLSCFLGSLIMRRLTESNVVRGLYFLAGTIFILFSPWIIIPYSDTYGMLFVMLGMWGLICLDQRYWKWSVTAFAASVGYLIKPTCIFPLFTAYIVYGTRYVLCLRERRKELFALVICTAVFWGIRLLIPLWIQHTYSFQLSPHYRITYTHYLMMGINEDTGGAFSLHDFLYSSGFPNVETREQGNRERYIQRLGELWENKRLGKFIRDKALINFNDGTFAWNGEGGFFYVRMEHDNIFWKWFSDTMIPPDTWDNEGKHYALYRTVMQALWLQVLTGIALAGFGGKSHLMQKACLMVALCGLMAFVMIFEARARYLFLYAPAFLILSLCGYETAWKRCMASRSRRRRGGEDSYDSK